MNWVDRQEVKARGSQIARSTQPLKDLMQGMAWIPLVILFHLYPLDFDKEQP
jgi:hypothetical protein